VSNRPAGPLANPDNIEARPLAAAGRVEIIATRGMSRRGFARFAAALTKEMEASSGGLRGE
jgi:hypothetical protein